MEEEEAPEADQHDEFEVIKRSLHSMKEYKRNALNFLSYKQRSLALCSIKHKSMYLNVGIGKFYEHIMNCIEANQVFLNDVVTFAEG